MKRQEVAATIGYQYVEQHLLSGLTLQDCSDIGLVPEGDTFSNYAYHRLRLDRSLQPQIWRRWIDNTPYLAQLVPDPEHSPYSLTNHDEIQVRKKSLQTSDTIPSFEAIDGNQEQITQWVSHFMKQWFVEQEEEYGIGHDTDEFLAAAQSVIWLNLTPIPDAPRKTAKDSLPLALNLKIADSDGEIQPLSMILTDQTRIESVMRNLFSPENTKLAHYLMTNKMANIQRRLQSKLKKEINAAADLKREHTEGLAIVGNLHVLSHLINRLYQESLTKGGGDLIIRICEGVNSYEDRLFFRVEGQGLAIYWRNLDQKDRPEFKGVLVKCTEADNIMKISVEKPEHLRPKDYDPQEFFQIMESLEVVHPEAFAFYRLCGKGSEATDREYSRWLRSLKDLSLPEILGLFRYQHDDAWADVAVSFLNNTPILRWKESRQSNNHD